MAIQERIKGLSGWSDSRAEIRRMSYSELGKRLRNRLGVDSP